MTVGELSEILARYDGKMQVHVRGFSYAVLHESIDKETGDVILCISDAVGMVKNSTSKESP